MASAPLSPMRPRPEASGKSVGPETTPPEAKGVILPDVITLPLALAMHADNALVTSCRKGLKR